MNLLCPAGPNSNGSDGKESKLFDCLSGRHFVLEITSYSNGLVFTKPESLSTFGKLNKLLSLC